ncbi:hypothetical protein BKA58DRAFT_146188 [Alternaria rosae]|uniref:uncharacterized protein n=1 Tax=Alternaria rosae TaxID=1187941 RepID=UPI001E8CF43E|nr:uncharacterized protein BKA58DRAFT_146188 [Alternaria rosae]KAH6872447.1 hypothetical protein BKA58DRAFT_146188 [Alternaria rosae]
MDLSRKTCVTYVAADCGSIIPGKSRAAAAFKTVDIYRRLVEAGVNVIDIDMSKLPDCDDLAPGPDVLDGKVTYKPSSFVPGDIRNRAGNLELLRRVRRKMSVNFQAEPRAFQLVLGGECCMLPAILSSVKKEYHESTTGLVYIDADTDLHSPLDDDWMGYFASMTMTQLMARPGAISDGSEGTLDPVLAREKLCDGTNTVFFGTNLPHPGNKPKHLAYLNDEHFKVISSEALANHPEGRANEALEHLEQNKVEAIWVHLDIDSIDPGEFPLANVPNFTGVTFQTMMQALSVFVASTKVVGLSIAEVNPDHDPDLAMTTMLTKEIVSMLARRELVDSF